MSLNLTQSRRWMGRRRGSALILTMLIMLVLGALGMMALRDVSRSVQQSGAYRVRTQADGFSEAAVEFTSTQGGNDAKTFWAEMNSDHATRSEAMLDDDNMELNNRKSLTRRGAYKVLTQRAGGVDSARDDFEHISSSSEETGLLGDGSFETAEPNTEFSVILRDPLDGPPMPGYDDNHCFKKITIASRALLGRPDRDWSGGGMMAERRHGVETFIGPLPCGAQ